MSVSRRRFIAGGAVVVATHSLAPGWVPSASAKPARDLFASSAPFKKQVGSQFKVKGTKRKLVLRSVTDFRLPGQNENGASGAGFSLEFTGAALGEGTQTLTHPKLGTFAIFLAPAGGTSDLQAIVNRLR